jgi:thymidine phosphorylase
MLLLGGLAETREDAWHKAERALDSGAAAESFSRMVAALGGPSDFFERPSVYLPQAAVEMDCVLDTPGVIAAIDTRQVGVAVIELGGGRRHASHHVDHAVGLTQVLGIGDDVGPDRPFARVLAQDAGTAEVAIQRLRAAVTVADEAAPRTPVVLERLVS